VRRGPASKGRSPRASAVAAIDRADLRRGRLMEERQEYSAAPGKSPPDRRRQQDAVGEIGAWFHLVAHFTAQKRRHQGLPYTKSANSGDTYYKITYTKFFVDTSRFLRKP